MKINETKHSTILVYNIEYFIMSQYIYMYVYLNNESQCYVNNMCILTIFSYRFCKKLILTKISIKKILCQSIVIICSSSVLLLTIKTHSIFLSFFKTTMLDP